MAMDYHRNWDIEWIMIIDIALLSWMDRNGIILGRYAIAVASCYGLYVIILDEFNDFIEWYYNGLSSATGAYRMDYHGIVIGI